MFEITEKAMELMQKNLKARFPSNTVEQLINFSWKYSAGKGLFEASTDGLRKIFCLLMPTHRGEAIFVKAEKSNTTWTIVRTLFRDPNSDTKNEKIWNEDLFATFPNLRVRWKELAENRLIGWKPEVIEPSGPESLDKDAISTMVRDAYSVYRDRPYHPSVFGFSDQKWRDGIVKHILETYLKKREQNEVVEAALNTYVCNIELTNVNRESLYLIINTDSSNYDLSTLARVAIDYPDNREILFNAILSCNPRERERRGFLGYPLLSTWAYHTEDQYKELREQLLPEKWFFANDDNTVDNELKAIRKYVENTFVRLLWENKVMVVNNHKRIAENLQDAKWSVFNTGLVNRSYQTLYAVFRRNDREKPIWKLDCFEVDGHRVMHSIPYPPERANYFKSMQDMFYDLKVQNAKNPDIDIDHVLIDNFDRLPDIAQKKYLGNDYEKYLIADDRSKKKKYVKIVHQILKST